MDCLEVLVELVEAVVPRLALFVDPVDRRVEPFGLEVTRSRLGLAATGDEAAVLQHLDVFRHRLPSEPSLSACLALVRSAIPRCPSKGRNGVHQDECSGWLTTRGLRLVIWDQISGCRRAQAGLLLAATCSQTRPRE